MTLKIGQGQFLWSCMFKLCGQESKKQLAVYDSDTPVSLKQGQGHQTWYALVDPNQGYNHTMFEQSNFNSVREKAKVKVSVKSGNMSTIFLLKCQSQN